MSPVQEADGDGDPLLGVQERPSGGVALGLGAELAQQVPACILLDTEGRWIGDLHDPVGQPGLDAAC